MLITFKHFLHDDFVHTGRLNMSVKFRFEILSDCSENWKKLPGGIFAALCAGIRQYDYLLTFANRINFRRYLFYGVAWVLHEFKLFSGIRNAYKWHRPFLVLNWLQVTACALPLEIFDHLWALLHLSRWVSLPDIMAPPTRTSVFLSTLSIRNSASNVFVIMFIFSSF